MKMLRVVSTLLFVACFVFPVNQKLVVADELTDLIKESVRFKEDVMKQKDADPFAQSAAMKHQARLLSAMRSADKRPAERGKEISEQRARLDLLQRIEQYANSEPADRKRILEEAETKLKSLETEQIAKWQNYQKAHAALNAKYADRHEQIAKAMTKVFRQRGESDFASLQRQAVKGSYFYCSAEAVYGENATDVLSVNVEHDLEPSFSKQKESWGDKVSLMLADENLLVVQAGEFSVSAETKGPKQWDKQKFKSAVRQLINWDALSAVNTQESMATDELTQLVKQSITMGKKAWQMLPASGITSNVEMSNHTRWMQGIRDADKQTDSRRKQIKTIESRLAFLERIETFASSNPAKRKKLFADATQAQAKLIADRRKQVQEAAKRISKLNTEHARRHQELGVAFKPLFRERGQGDYAAVIRQGVEGDFLRTTAKATYQRDSKPVLAVAMEHMPITSKPKESWSDKVGFFGVRSGIAYVNAGEFLLRITPATPKDWNENQLKEVAQQLVDLDAISKLKTK